MTRAATLLALLFASVAIAEEGNLTVELGGGGTALQLPTPYALSQNDSRPGQLGTAALARGGVRYGLTHWLDVGVSGFWEPAVRFTHRDVTLAYGGSSSVPQTWPGALEHQVTRFGASAGARLTFGLRLRFFGELHVGWARRQYSALHAYNGADPAVEWPVAIPDFAVDNLITTASAGVEYFLTDSLSLGVAPRFDVLIGRESTLAASLPLVLSWRWSL